MITLGAIPFVIGTVLFGLTASGIGIGAGYMIWEYDWDSHMDIDNYHIQEAEITHVDE